MKTWLKTLEYYGEQTSRFKLPHISDIYKTAVVVKRDITTIKQPLSKTFRDELRLGEYRKTDLVTRQCNKTGNVRTKVTMSHAEVTVVTVETQYVWRVFVACYLASKVHVPYCNATCGLSGAPTFITSFHKRHDFRKNVTEHSVCFDFAYNFCPNHFILSKTE